MESKKRIPQLDILKLFAIYLVIWGHVLMVSYPSNYIESPLFRAIYSFHMALFMMISGYFSTSSIKLPTKVFFRKKIMQLIYPCFAWGLLYFIYTKFVSLSNSPDLELYESFSLSRTLTDIYWYSDFWFLKSCFICYLIVFICHHYGLKDKYWIPLSLLASQFIPPFQVSFMYPCFIIGYILKQRIPLQKIVKYKYHFTCIFLLMLLFWDTQMWDNSHGFPSNFTKLELIQQYNIAVARLFRLFVGIFGGLTFFTLFIEIPDTMLYNNVFNKLCKWGQYTLEVYIVQNIVLERIICNYLESHDMYSIFFSTMVSPFTSLILLILCLLVIKTLYKYKFLTFILFGKHSR